MLDLNRMRKCLASPADTRHLPWGRRKPPCRSHSGWIDAAGGLYATASDLALWDVALASGKVLKPESFELMRTPRRSRAKDADYGCGLGIGKARRRGDLSHTAASAALSPTARWRRGRNPPSSCCQTAITSQRAHARPFSELDQSEKDGPSVPKVNGPSPKTPLSTFCTRCRRGKSSATSWAKSSACFYRQRA